MAGLPLRRRVTVATDANSFSNDLSEFIPYHEDLATFSKGNFQNMDQPRHRELRGLVSQGFTPRFVTGWRRGSKRWRPSCSTRSATASASTWSPIWHIPCRSPSSPR